MRGLMEQEQGEWVLWRDLKGMFVVASLVSVVMVAVGITQHGVVSAMTFSGVYVLSSVLCSLVWSWRNQQLDASPSAWSLLLVVGGIGVVGHSIIFVATRSWSALLNAGLIAVFMLGIWWTLKDVNTKTERAGG